MSDNRNGNYDNNNNVGSNFKTVKSSFAKIKPYVLDDPHDILTYGLNESVIYNEATKVYDPNTMIVNPFFVGLNGGSVLQIPKREFYSTYS